MADLLAAALAHAERGWHVFPLRPDDKRPAVRDWENRATTDPDRIRRAWTHRPYGIGIACGPSGLVVVDLDVPEGDTTGPTGLDKLAELGGIDPTYAVATGRDGTHLYYQHPAAGPELRNTASRVAPMVDTRAHGGYVVAAGSTVAGRPYRVVVDCDPAPLPAWLAGRLSPTPRPNLARPRAVVLPPDRRGRYVAAAIRRQVSHLAAATEGTRNRVLFASAVALGQLAAGGALSDDDVFAALEPVALSIGLRPGEIRRTIASGLRVGARQPRRLTDLREAA